MENESTISVDPDELSDQVVKELVEKGELEKDQAESFAERAWVKETMVENTESTGFSTHIGKLLKKVGTKSCSVILGIISSIVLFSDRLERFVKQKFDTWMNHKTITATVKRVEVVEKVESVELHIEHDLFDSTCIRLGLRSTALSNLLEYKGLENPIDLEKESVFIDPSSFDEKNLSVLIPHNVSQSGKSRFKIFCIWEEIREKIRLRIYPEIIGELLISILISMFILFIGSFATVGYETLSAVPILNFAVFGLSSVPIIISSILFILVFIHVTILSLSWIISNILKSDFKSIDSV